MTNTHHHYLGPSWKLIRNNKSQEHITKESKEALQEQILNEFASLDERFHMHFEDLDYMLHVLDEYKTPMTFYETAMEFPHEYEEYVNDDRGLDTNCC